MCRQLNWTFVLIWAFVFIHLKGAMAGLQANGCDDGWTNFGKSCYKIGAGDLTADSARSQCRNVDSYLASVWSLGEMAFVVSLWQFSYIVVREMWLGLSGSTAGNWVYHDQSEIKNKERDDLWYVYKDVFPVPKATPNICAVFQVDGGVDFKNCSEIASAYVCKKALPMVFVVMNNTRSKGDDQLVNVQPFERLLPPTLTSLSAAGPLLEAETVTSELDCAFRCFNETECRSFQVSCQLKLNCEGFLCTLYSKLPV